MLNVGDSGDTDNEKKDLTSFRQILKHAYK